MVVGGGVHTEAKKKKDANLKKKILRNKTRSLIKQGTQQNEQEGGETIKMKKTTGYLGGLAGYLKSKECSQKRLKKQSKTESLHHTLERNTTL